MALTTVQRGYGAQHKAERARWAPLVEAGQAVCVRCGLPIQPGSQWHLDHTEDRTGYLGVSHARCNRKAGAKLGARRRWGTRTAITRSRW
jgi:hypothetical protein